MASEDYETGERSQSTASSRSPSPETGGMRGSAVDGHSCPFRRPPEDQEYDTEAGEITLQKLETEFNQRKFTTELDKRKTNLLSEIQVLHQRLKNEGPQYVVERLMSVLEVLKDLEKRESDFQYSCRKTCTSMQVGIMELERGICNADGDQVDASVLNRSIVNAQERLNLAKRELGAKLRAIFSLKRQIDDVPTQTELIQYELRFSELYVQIQERLRQTRKHYDTYNALLEIKELMLKEISLLNSISSQFQEAILDTAGSSKLIDSMEAIVKGTQQKLKKVEVGLDSEQRSRDLLKERYSAAIAAQRRFSSLLKAFQEECAKHVGLRNLTST